MMRHEQITEYRYCKLLNRITTWKNFPVELAAFGLAADRLLSSPAEMWNQFPLVGQGRGMSPVLPSGVLPVALTYGSSSHALVSATGDTAGSRRNESPTCQGLPSVVSVVNHNVVGMDWAEDDRVTPERIQG